MNRIAGFVSAVIISAILVVFAHPGLTIENTYIEDFSTSLYKDFDNTTAWWDKAAGELKLFPFVQAIIGTRDTPGYALGVAVSGNHAFVADDYMGFQVIDISDPSNPVITGTYDTPGYARGVAIDGNHAFVADSYYGLQVIDITNPAGPTLAGTYNTPDYAWSVAVSGDIVYIADGTTGLVAIDILNPASPALIGTCNTPGVAEGVEVAGDLAFVADYTYGLQVIDISDPADPAIVGTWDTPGSAAGVTVSGTHAFVADGAYGLQIIDVGNPANPVLVGTCDTPGSAAGVTVSGDRAYVSDYTSGLHVIDISDPASPTIVNTCDTPGGAMGVAVTGEHAFVADYGSGFQVVRISHPVSAPALLGICNLPAYAQGIAVSGDHVFVADGYDGLQVIDISDPANPTLTGTCCPSNCCATAIAVSGDHAFVANGDSSLFVIDISDPANPILTGTCITLGHHSVSVAVSGNYVFVQDYDTRNLYFDYNAFHTIDISDLLNPTLVATYESLKYFNGIAVSGNYVFRAGVWGLNVIDISDPTNPAYAGGCRLNDDGVDVAISGDHAFVAIGSSGLKVIDISDPINATVAGTCNTPGVANGIAVSGDRAFVADGSSGLQVIDISDPANPTIVGNLAASNASHVAVSGDRVILTDGTDLMVIRVFQSEVDSDNNIGWSLAVDDASRKIFRARIKIAQEDIVTWELSADGGINWQGIDPNGSWNYLTVPGTDLVWRSTHTWAWPGINPLVASLEIDWLDEEPLIDSIVDVPDDQGGCVRVNFKRSGRDFANETALPLMYYGVWRRIDSVALMSTLESRAQVPFESVSLESPASLPPESGVSMVTEVSLLPGESASGDPLSGGLPVTEYEGRTFVVSRPGLAASSFPPGIWEWVATVPAVQKDTYIAAVPTVADSSATGNQIVLVLTAHTTTPTIWYVSEPDSGWSVDNIAPAAPMGFAVAYNTGSGNYLSWDPSLAEDFHYFRVYRSSDPDFVPSPSDLVRSTTKTEWIDPDYDGWNVYYKITALDYVENESDPASPGTVTDADGPEVPKAFALYPNVPNPFNPSTTIRYDVPSGGGAVTLRIYDVSGRLVRTLVDGPQTAGQKTVIWDGKDDSGRSAASGVYFSRLQAPGYNKTMKMILLK